MIRHANRWLKFNLRLDCVGQQSPISANRLTLISGLNLIHLQSGVNSLVGRLNLKQNGWLIFSSLKDAHEFINTTIVYSLTAIKHFGLTTDLTKSLFSSILLHASNAVGKFRPYEVKIFLNVFRQFGYFWVWPIYYFFVATLICFPFSADTILETLGKDSL